VGDAINQNTTLQILNIAQNKLDGTAMWKLIDVAERSKSVLEIHLTQLEDTCNPKLAYKLCELFLNSKNLQKLYYNVNIPANIVFSSKNSYLK